jgi:hypothetical protein
LFQIDHGKFIVGHGNAEKRVGSGGRTKGEAKLTECCCMKPRSAATTETTSPEELMMVLKRYLRESNESEIVVASRIGVNHHTFSRWLTTSQSPTKGQIGLNRVLPAASRIPLVLTA